MKKVLLLFVSVILILTATACGSNSELEQLRQENEELKQQLATPSLDSEGINELSTGDIIKLGEDLVGKSVRVSGYVNQITPPVYNEKYGYITYYLKFSNNEQIQVNYSGPDARTIQFSVLDILEAEGTVEKVYKVSDNILQITCQKLYKIGTATPPPGSPLLNNNSQNTSTIPSPTQHPDTASTYDGEITKSTKLPSGYPGFIEILSYCEVDIPNLIGYDASISLDENYTSVVKTDLRYKLETSRLKLKTDDSYHSAILILEFTDNTFKTYHYTTVEVDGIKLK